MRRYAHGQGYQGAALRDGVTVDKLVLLDKNIKYCTNCLSCRDSKVEGDYVPCIISDDMDEIAPIFTEADAFIFGTSIIVGNVHGCDENLLG